MKVEIDDELCAGHGRCYVLVPSLFADDDMGRGAVVPGDGEVPPELEEDARRAAKVCPERAIRIIS